MTSLVALATKDSLVMGADSLGTVTRLFVDPLRFAHLFDPADGFMMRRLPDGSPALGALTDLLQEAQQIPYNQVANVRKLFDLSPLPMGVMFTGVTSIGDRTIGSLVQEFRETDSVLKRAQPPPNYTVRATARRLLTFMHTRYRQVFSNFSAPALELLLGGYDRNDRLPRLVRIDVAGNKVDDPLAGNSRFGPAFGGQRDWIQRIVFGTDLNNYVRIEERSKEVLRQYRDSVIRELGNSGIAFTPPDTESASQLKFFDGWSLDGLDANWGDFSEQNAIECVDFFLDIMIRAQSVSSQLPTVGGDVHIGVIRKDGFRFVTPEVWRHDDHSTEIPGVPR